MATTRKTKLFFDKPLDELPIRPNNVGEVPLRSPFRYPGGKTEFIFLVRAWLKNMPPQERSLLVEPFAGGASIGLDALFDGLVEHLYLIEIDPDIAAVWQTILSREGARVLQERINRFIPSEEAVMSLLSTEPSSTLDQAFRSIVLNRVNRAGIIAPGAGRLKRGEKNKGLASRWYPQTLMRRIAAIQAMSSRILFEQRDGLEVLAESRGMPGAVFFIDPPYSVTDSSPGKRLYTYSEIDHSRLFEILKDLRRPFLATYEFSNEVVGMANKFGFMIGTVEKKNSHHKIKKELLISNNLGPLSVFRVGLTR